VTRRVLILRPEPGCGITARRATAAGLDPVPMPLFQVVPRPWQPPAGPFDAVMMTSANAARHVGDGIAPWLSLPLYAVGRATADAARRIGFANIHRSDSGGALLAAQMARDGIARAFHPAGEDRITGWDVPVEIRSVTVYASDEIVPAPDVGAAIAAGAIALLHSPRAARRFAAIVPDRARTRIAALSPQVLAAAGTGWADAIAADRPDDDALLAAATRLCDRAASCDDAAWP
jgi:uroporphyrinogen-III synthase